jgi:hypothetical protein
MLLGYLTIAVSLKVLDGVVTVYLVRFLCVAWSGNVLIRDLLVLMADMGAMSRSNVWMQEIFRPHYDLEIESATYHADALALSIEPQGEQDV